MSTRYNVKNSISEKSFTWEKISEFKKKKYKKGWYGRKFSNLKKIYQPAKSNAQNSISRKSFEFEKNYEKFDSGRNFFNFVKSKENLVCGKIFEFGKKYRKFDMKKNV